ncbi:amidase [Gracilibacillus sp. YIM 98692]|uniref:amidase n=1 Tax=Gracilibacillus sp. YIM 98692 TaxID=2663532 RepID=UPI0013D04B94|nr:amidase [Gracilibacillus sp. YIM 98692]
MEDQWRAFIDQDCIIPKKYQGLLNSYTFAVKDVFDIKGSIASAGNPYWRRTHLPARSNASVIEKLLNNGAELVGKTHTDELMYSLNGENHFFGTPVNPKQPKRIPGGSSSGSAVAVAAGLVDFALGTDTGGSVRIPSSYCGIYGYRPSHNAISMKGVIPLAQSFDTVGVMTKDVNVLANVVKTLVRQINQPRESFSTIIYPEDVWELIDSNIKSEMEESFVTNERRKMSLAKGELKSWMEAFRIIQGYEIWGNHGDWIEKVNPVFGPGIMERFMWTKTITRQQLQWAKQKREDIQSATQELLREDTIMVMPTSPNIAPLLGTSGEELQVHRNKLLMMTSIAGLNGLPQVTIPSIEVDGAPVGLSFIAGPNQDGKLIDYVKDFVLKRDQEKVMKGV